MTQAEIDSALERHRHLLDGTWPSAAKVAQRVCWDLRRSFALIRKDGGTRCEAPGGVFIDCDKVINRLTYDVYDTVISAGSPANRVGWLHEGKHPDLANRLVEPTDYASGGGGTGGGGGGTGTAVCRFQVWDVAPILARLDALEQAMRAVSDTTVGAEVAALEATAAVKDLTRALQSPGLQVDGSLSLSTRRISGTVRLPSGGAV